MKMILAIPVSAAKAIFDLLMGYDDISEQLRAQRYKAQMLMLNW
jgi:chemotaxis protein CheY-P-specific phosphatase CheC